PLRSTRPAIRVLISLEITETLFCHRHTDSGDTGAAESAVRYLSSDERARRNRFRFERDRRDFAMAHDLLRRTLSRYADVRPEDWRFTADRHGKPSIDTADAALRSLAFSLSHTSGCVACAVSKNHLVGVDVERTDRRVSTRELAWQCFSPDEANWLRQFADSQPGFSELWTLKEAFLKALGT